MMKDYDYRTRVSMDGHIETNRAVNGRPLKNGKWRSYDDKVPAPTGYIMVLTSFGQELAHRVVWTAFNGEIPYGYHIHHKNGNKTDNRLCNLECIPHGGIDGHQSRHAKENWANGLMDNCSPRMKELWKSGHFDSKLKSIVIRNNYTGEEKKYKSCKDVCDALGVSKHAIRDYIRGKQKTILGGLYHAYYCLESEE